MSQLPKRQLGVIELTADLDIETATEIFVRINAAGVALSQADFAMSKIAADTEHDGQHLRKNHRLLLPPRGRSSFREAHRAK